MSNPDKSDKFAKTLFKTTLFIVVYLFLWKTLTLPILTFSVTWMILSFFTFIHESGCEHKPFTRNRMSGILLFFSIISMFMFSLDSLMLFIHSQ